MKYFLINLIKEAMTIIIFIILSPIIGCSYLFSNIKRSGIKGIIQKIRINYQDFFNGYVSLSPRFIYCDDGKKLFEYRLTVGLYGRYNSFLSIGANSACKLREELDKFLSAPRSKMLNLELDFGGGMSQSELINRMQAQKIIALYDELNSKYETYEEAC